MEDPTPVNWGSCPRSPRPYSLPTYPPTESLRSVVGISTGGRRRVVTGRGSDWGTVTRGPWTDGRDTLMPLGSTDGRGPESGWTRPQSVSRDVK